MGDVQITTLDRPTALIEAAIEVIDTTGLRGLTHRATETRAQLPPGTCSHHFPTRQALIVGLLTQIAEAEKSDIEHFSFGQLSTDMAPATLLEGATATVAHWLGPARARTRAGLLLALDPASRDLVTDTISVISASFRDLASRVTGDPDLADFVAVLVNGLVVGELVSDQSIVDIDRLRTRLAIIVDIAIPGNNR